MMEGSLPEKSLSDAFKFASMLYLFNRGVHMLYWVCLEVNVFASHAVSRRFALRPGHTKCHHKKWYKPPPCMARMR